MEQASAFLDAANLVAYVGAAVVAAVEAIRSRTRASVALATVFALLAIVAVVDEFGTDALTGRQQTVVTLLAFAGAGYAVLEHRASLVPVRPGWRVAAAVGIAASVTWLIATFPAEPPLPAVPLVAFVAVWGVCVLGSAVSLWRGTAEAEPVQRAQLRLLAAAYAGIATVLAVTVAVGIAGQTPDWIDVGISVLILLVVPGLYLAAHPPAAVRHRWLRRQASSRARRLNPVGSWYLDLATGDVWWSPAVRSMIPFDDELTPDADWFFDEVVHEEDRERVRAEFERAVAESRRLELELRIVRPADGRVRWMHSRGEPLADLEHGAATALFGTLRDITDRKRSEEQLQRALDKERAAAAELRRLNDLKNAFLSAVSHELRTPLTALRGFSDTLQDRWGDLDEQSLELLLERMSHNAERLDALLSDLLDLDRLTRGELEPRREPVDVAGLIRSAVAEIDPEGHDIRLELPEGIRARLDAGRIERVVENLVANAVHHTPEGTPVWVRASRWDEDVHLVVEDAGPGVPDELKQAVFEPFRQGTESPARGTGIGLAVVAEFTTMHGGRVWITDRPDGGACFHVALPREPATDTEGSGPLTREVL